MAPNATALRIETLQDQLAALLVREAAIRHELQVLMLGKELIVTRQAARRGPYGKLTVLRAAIERRSLTVESATRELAEHGFDNQSETAVRHLLTQLKSLPLSGDRGIVRVRNGKGETVWAVASQSVA